MACTDQDEYDRLIENTLADLHDVDYDLPYWVRVCGTVDKGNSI